MVSLWRAFAALTGFSVAVGASCGSVACVAAVTLGVRACAAGKVHAAAAHLPGSVSVQENFSQDGQRAVRVALLFTCFTVVRRVPGAQRPRECLVSQSIVMSMFSTFLQEMQ